MCCQESGEREASVTLYCPWAKPGEKRYRKVRHSLTSSLDRGALFSVPFSPTRISGSRVPRARHSPDDDRSAFSLTITQRESKAAQRKREKLLLTHIYTHTHTHHEFRTSILFSCAADRRPIGARRYSQNGRRRLAKAVAHVLERHSGHRDILHIVAAFFVVVADGEQRNDPSIRKNKMRK